MFFDRKNLIKLVKIVKKYQNNFIDFIIDLIEFRGFLAILIKFNIIKTVLKNGTFFSVYLVLRVGKFL